MKIRLLFCAAMILATGAWAQSAVTDAAITNACTALLRNAKDAKAQAVIQAAVAEDELPAAMRCRAMVLCALPFLQQMNTNLFGRAVQALLAKYPDEGPAVLGVTESDWLAPCPQCNGDGAKVATCPPCAGTGKCPACKGTKKASSGAACQACKGTGVCGRCDDKRVVRTACLECKGTGKVFVLSPNIARQYEKVLSELKALALENLRFAEESKKALAVTRNPKERIAALSDVIAAFPNRPDLVPLIKAREAAQAGLDEEAAKKQAQEERNRMTQEKDALINASSDLPFRSIPTLVSRIDAFIAQHPKSEYETELEILKSKLQSRHAIYTNLWRGFYVLLGVIGALFVVTTIREAVARRTRKEKLLKIPGMENLNTDEFTDPLSDSRKAAAMREAGDDLGIYP